MAKKKKKPITKEQAEELADAMSVTMPITIPYCPPSAEASSTWTITTTNGAGSVDASKLSSGNYVSAGCWTGDLWYDYGSSYPVNKYKNIKAKCSCCEKQKRGTFMTYKGHKTERYICEACWIKKIDKLFGINGKLEELLFKKEE